MIRLQVRNLDDSNVGFHVRISSSSIQLIENPIPDGCSMYAPRRIGIAPILILWDEGIACEGEAVHLARGIEEEAVVHAPLGKEALERKLSSQMRGRWTVNATERRQCEIKVRSSQF
jgi:hypothetical protein